jgi:hypothetical protein
VIWRRLCRELVTAAVILAAATVLFIIGDLAIHGTVNW